MNTQNKYSDVPLDVTIAGGSDILLNKLMKRKSRLDLCKIMAWHDEELGWLDVYYREINAPISPQTDESEDCYSIECVKLNTEAIEISGDLEQRILIWLNENKK